MAATMNTHTPERRHLMERRTGVSSLNEAHWMNAADWIAMVLLIIGGLNWGLVGLFNMDLVARIFGEASAISRAIYTLVGLSALYSIYTASKMSRPHS